MQFLVTLLSIFSVALCAIPLSVEVPANGRQCLYVRAHEVNARIRAAFSVMSGGQFDIDATLTRPDQTVVERVERVESDEWLLNAPEIGEYELCFYNEMSTVTDKLVEFEFTVDTKTLEAKAPPVQEDENSKKMEQYVNNIDQLSSQITRGLNYLKSRYIRNESTVKSTNSRVWWFTVLELLAVVAMAIFNVSIVQIFFKGSRKNIV